MPCVDFVKSIDEVYKELRLLRASVANSSKIDRAFESILNFLFYTIAFCLILSQLGYDPLALFLSIVSFHD
jgi:1,4-dihydroxy-2-naphthoate octaprenyltransferase